MFSGINFISLALKQDSASNNIDLTRELTLIILDKIKGMYENKVVLQEIIDLIKENKDIKWVASELKDEVEYGKQRESKLMYFLYLMQQKKFPVYEIFEQYIKDLPTSRFSPNWDDRFKEIYIEQK